VETQNQEQEGELQVGTSCGGVSIWGPTQGWNDFIRDFVGPPRGLRKIEAPHMNKDSCPLAVLMLLFTGIFQ
jgi:hypothetical protein